MTDEEIRTVFPYVLSRLDELERIQSDHTQRFDTLQTSPFKRLWWWLKDGWPLTDLNANKPNWRPTNRRRQVR